MLTPTDVHFLVGLLNKVAQPENVEIELGSVLTDVSTDSPRDVDITIIVRNLDGTIFLFQGIEVKAHSGPLDITHVEQLCMKFQDLPQIDRRVIVSASGYTSSAVRKAAYHDVSLFILRDMNNSDEAFMHFQFPAEGLYIMQPALRWIGQPNVRFMLPENRPESPIKFPQSISDINGDYIPNLNSDNLTIQIRAAAAEEHLSQLIKSNRLQKNYSESVYFRVHPSLDTFLKTDNGEVVHIDFLEVTGVLEDNTIRELVIPKVLIEQGSNQPYVSCAITETNQGNLIGITANQENRNVDFINIPLSDRQKKKILKITI